MIIEESYIQYSDGYIKRDVTPSDISKALNDFSNEELNIEAFWVGIYEEDRDELVMETSHDLKVSINFGVDQSVKFLQAENAEQVESLYEFFINLKRIKL